MQDSNLDKIIKSILIASISVLLIHIYVYTYPIFNINGGIGKFINEIILRLRGTGLFNSMYHSKIISLVFLIIAGWGFDAKKNEKIEPKYIVAMLIMGLLLFIPNNWILNISSSNTFKYIYIIVLVIGYILIMTSIIFIYKLLKTDLKKDPFNEENESFKQETRLMENEYSVNIPTEFYYNKKWNKGWINVVNPFRATMVLGTPGSGKSFAIINNFIKQQIEKGFTMYCYDYKFPDLSNIVYNHLLNNNDGYKIVPNFYVINFDDPAKSHRCNPLNPNFMDDISDAYEASYTIMLNLNKTWAQKQGDFFVESPIILFAAIIWFLRIYESEIYEEMIIADDASSQEMREFQEKLQEQKYYSIGEFIEEPTVTKSNSYRDINGETKKVIVYKIKKKLRGAFCSLPHAMELINIPYEKLFPILTSYEELANYLSPFMNAWKGGAQDQLQGQIASAQIPITRMISPELYWVMSGNDFSLDINNPDEPKVLCVGNNPDKQNIYSAALALYNSRIVKLINKKGKQKSSVIIDELPTIFFRGLDNLIATARSNKVAVCLGFQDFSQLNRDYGDKESKAIQNTIGNIFSGQVVGETANTISQRFGKVLQQRESISINKNDTSRSISTQMDNLIPASKISTLSQGMFVGAVADNFGEEINQKIFNCKIIVDAKKVKEEEARYEKIPIIHHFDNDQDKKLQVKENYKDIKRNIQDLIESEIERIKNDPDLAYLFDE